MPTLNKLKKFTDRVKYLPNGFFSDLASIDTEQIAKEKIILTVGRLGDYSKNTELLVETLITLKDQLEDWQVYLVGSMTEAFKQYLRNVQQEHPALDAKIITTGNITDKTELYRIYAKAGIFVLPSRVESWGLVVPEAMHFADYPIVTQCCDAFEEVLMDSSAGRIVENESKEALRNALLYAISDFESTKAKGKISKKIADDNFDWKIVAQKLDDYLFPGEE